MKFYEGFKRKGLLGLRLHQANERVRREREREAVWFFPMGVRKATKRVGQLRGGHLEPGHPTSSMSRQNQESVVQERFAAHSLSSAWKERSCGDWGGVSQADGSGNHKITHGCYFMIVGKSHQPKKEENSPWEGGGCFPVFAIELK